MQEEEYTSLEKFQGFLILVLMIGGIYWFFSGDETELKSSTYTTENIEKNTSNAKKEASEVKVKKRTPEEQREHWRNSTDDYHIEIVTFFIKHVEPFPKLESRHGEEALKPHIYSIVDCIDERLNEKKWTTEKYKDVGIDLMLEACTLLELVKIKKNQ